MMEVGNKLLLIPKELMLNQGQLVAVDQLSAGKVFTACDNLALRNVVVNTVEPVMMPGDPRLYSGLVDLPHMCNWVKYLTPNVLLAQQQVPEGKARANLRVIPTPQPGSSPFELPGEPIFITTQRIEAGETVVAEFDPVSPILLTNPMMAVLRAATFQQKAEALANWQPIDLSSKEGSLNTKNKLVDSSRLLSSDSEQEEVCLKSPRICHSPNTSEDGGYSSETAHSSSEDLNRSLSTVGSLDRDHEDRLGDLAAFDQAGDEDEECIEVDVEKVDDEEEPVVGGSQLSHGSGDKNPFETDLIGRLYPQMQSKKPLPTTTMDGRLRAVPQERLLAPQQPKAGIRSRSKIGGGETGRSSGGKRLLPCPTCGKQFDRPSLLERHIRIHTGERPYVCDFCEKGFSTSSSLNTHRRIHTGEKPHVCKTCGKCFTASSNLYYHRMTHLKEKPHQCPQCPKSFSTPGDLRNHARIHSSAASTASASMWSSSSSPKMTSTLSPLPTSQSNNFFPFFGGTKVFPTQAV